MPDTVIARVNHLGKGEPKELVFKDRKGRVIGDVELPGVEHADDSTAKIDNATVIEVDNEFDPESESIVDPFDDEEDEPADIQVKGEPAAPAPC